MGIEDRAHRAPTHVHHKTWGEGRETQHGTWYRGEVRNYAPGAAALRSARRIKKNVLHGWAPKRPQSPTTRK